VVDRRYNLPGGVALGQIAAAHGLFEGGRWCNSDYGHAQVGLIELPPVVIAVKTSQLFSLASSERRHTGEATLARLQI
jgi:hypothetical protein